MTQPEAIQKIRTERTYCGVIDAINTIIENMGQGEIMSISALTNLPNKKKLITYILKMFIEDGINITMSEDYFRFKKHF